MYTLMILAVIQFFNPSTGDYRNAMGEVNSVVECAKVINDNSHSIQTEQGTYYPVHSTCIIAKVQGESVTRLSPKPDWWEQGTHHQDPADHSEGHVPPKDGGDDGRANDVDTQG